MARSRWNGDDGTTHAEAWSARESRRVPVAFRSSTTSRPRRGRGKRRASHAAAPARPPMCNAGGRRGSLGLPNAGDFSRSPVKFWVKEFVRYSSRLSVTDFRRRSTRPERVERRFTHETYKKIHSSRAHERARPTPRYIAFSARHDPPRRCVRSSAAAKRRRKPKKTKNTRHLHLVTRPPPRWLFRGGTPPRSCTGTWRARRRPPPRRWRRSR